mgnify:CR=1 FL=1
MTDKEYNEFIKLYLRLKYLLKKYDEYYDYTLLKEEDETPIIIPPDVYDDICDELGSNEIKLMGIT